MADRDEETAPLLRDPEAEENANGEAPEPTWKERANAILQEPLTPLSKILLILALILLLLTAVFIGLFAGTQHKLNSERKHSGQQPPPETTTVSATTSIYTTTTATVPLPGPTGVPEEAVCLTSQCIVLSASVLESLDLTQDPCENFYEFANGGWLASHPLPADKGSSGQFEALAEQNKQVIRKILEAPAIKPASSTDAAILKKLRDFYSSCTNEDRLDELGQSPILPVIQHLRALYQGNISHTTSVGEKWANGLTAAVAYLHSLDVDALFSFEIEGDVGSDPNLMSLWFNQPELGLPSKEYYEEKSITNVYRDVLEQLLLAVDEDDESSILSKATSTFIAQEKDEDNSWPPWPWPPWGDDDDDDEPENKTQKAHKLAKKVLKFESKIAAASLDLDVLQQDPFATYNPAPLSNLTTSLPQIQFGEYFAALTPRSFPTRVIISHPPFVPALSNILANTSSDVIEAYLVTRVALALSPYLGTSTDAWKAQRTLVETLTGIKKGAIGDRAEYCISKVEENLGFAAGRYFVNETFGGESREKGTKVITDIIAAFETSLSSIDWMDEKSAKAAREKAEAIRVKVGFPISPDTGNPDAIARYYAGTKVDVDDFLGNILRSAASDKFRTWLQLGRARDKESWEMNPSTVNAYFNPPANEIVFPAGILQPPFFSKDWPAYLSYGSFGHVAAHELTHAFDSAGRLYNQEGKLEEWWTKNTSDGFNVKQDCIVKQFSDYTIDDGKGGRIHVNGNLTSGENIGDTGLIQAYRAWKAQYSDSFSAGNEYLLPGLEFTREQLFFVSFARIWARSMKPAAAVQRIRTDPHSPSIYRVEGTVSNIPEFAEAFKCSKKAKLNPPPEQQCIFWT